MPALQYQRVTPITASDAAFVSVPHQALLVTTGGNLVVEDREGTAVTCTGLTAGQVLPFAVRRVRATGTTATVAALY